MSRWTKGTLLGAVALAAALGLALVFTPPDSDGSGLPDASLPKLGGGEVSLARCPTDKCLTVVVAPWCGYCRASTAKLVELGRYLKSRQVETRVIVGMDKPGNLAGYAGEFGAEALLDPDGVMAVRGVPHFIVSDRDGNVVRTAAGVPPGGIGDVAEFAAGFGLP